MILSCHIQLNSAIIAGTDSSEFQAFNSLRAFLVRKTWILVLILRFATHPLRVDFFLFLICSSESKWWIQRQMAKKLQVIWFHWFYQSEDCTPASNIGHKICRTNEFISRFEIKLKSFDNGSLLSQIPNAVCDFIIFNEFIQLHESSKNGIQCRRISHRPMKLPIIIYLMLTAAMNWSDFIRYIIRSRPENPRHMHQLFYTRQRCVSVCRSEPSFRCFNSVCRRIWIYYLFTSTFLSLLESRPFFSVPKTLGLFGPGTQLFF